MSDPAHIPVLPREVVDQLDPQPGQTVLDCTAGLGGHALALGERVGASGCVALMDLDAQNLARAADRVRALPAPPRVVPLHSNFADAPRLLLEHALRADCLLADLGFSSNQLETAARGLSFQRDGPLDMRLDPSRGVTAAELVATLSEDELGEIIRDFGEERLWRRVARKLVEARAARPISTTHELAQLVRGAIGAAGRGQRIDPATRTFQALRIAVNDELGNLDALLESIRRTAGGAAPAERWLAHGARVAVITFHSLEDRRVKQAFADLTQRGLAIALTRKPVVAGESEIAANPRSRSAKLRAVRLL